MYPNNYFMQYALFQVILFATVMKLYVLKKMHIKTLKLKESAFGIFLLGLLIIIGKIFFIFKKNFAIFNDSLFFFENSFYFKFYIVSLLYFIYVFTLYIFPLLFDIFFYIKNYELYSNFKNALQLLYIAFLIKIFLCDSLILLFDFFLYSGYSSIESIIDNSSLLYALLGYIFSLSTFEYVASLYFNNVLLGGFRIKVFSSDELEERKNFTEEKINFSIDDLEVLLSYKVDFDTFFASLIKKNILTYFKDKSLRCEVFKKDKFEFIVGDQNSFVLHELQSSSYLLYDQYYDLYNKSFLIKNDLYKSENIKDIFSFLRNRGIRLIYPFFIREEVYFYIVLYKNGKEYDSFKSRIMQDLFLINYNIKYFFEKVVESDLYRKLKYQKNVIEADILENNEQFKKNYDELNRKVVQMNQFIFFSKGKNITITNNNMVCQEMQQFFIMQSKKEKSTEKTLIEKKYLIFNNKNYFLPLLTTKNISIQKNLLSFYVSLPFLNEDFKIIENSFYRNKLESFLFKNIYELKEDKNFFLNFFDSYNIKIIISSFFKYKSFYDFIAYYGSILEYCIVDISLKNINEDSYEKIFSYYLYQLKSDKQYIFFFRDGSLDNVEYQKEFLQAYMDIVIYNSYKIKKIFFIIEDKHDINSLYKKIYDISEIISFSSSFCFSAISQETKNQISNNYLEYIYKETFQKEVFEKFNILVSQKEIACIYQYLDEFKILTDKQKILLLEQNDELYIKEAIILGKKALKDHFLMEKLKLIYNKNYTKIATTLKVHKSTVSRYFKNTL